MNILMIINLLVIWCTAVVTPASSSANSATTAPPQYVTLKADTLIPAEASVLDIWVKPNTDYECIGKTSNGYLILVKDSNGKTFIGTLPWRDKMSNPTGTESKGTVKVHIGVIAKISDGYIPLHKTMTYRVVSETLNAYCLRFHAGSYAIDVKVAKDRVIPVILAVSPERLLQYTGSVIRIRTDSKTSPCKVVGIEDDSLLVKIADVFGSFEQAAETRVYFSEIKQIEPVVKHYNNYFTPDEIKTNQMRDDERWATHMIENKKRILKEAKQQEAVEQANIKNNIIAQENAASEQSRIASLREPAKHGDAESQYMLGLHYAQRKSAECDYLLAEMWLRKAADQGYAPAIREIGSLYWLGKGVVKDWIEGCSYWLTAVAFGDEESQLKIKVCHDVFLPEQIEEAKSRAHIHVKNIKDKMGIYSHSFFQDADMKARIKSEAQILSTAMESGDYEKAASRMPAELLEESGGLVGLKQAMEQAKGKSAKNTPHQEIGEVSSIAKAGQFTYAIVNTSMKIVTGSDTAIVKSYMVGISKDGGDNWVFLNGSDSAKERIIRKQPDLATTLIFPVRTMTTGGSRFMEVNGKWVPDENTYKDMKATADKLEKSGGQPK